MTNYFKNTELAARYNISEATVRNWIKYSKEGKIALELVIHESKTYVANSYTNIPIIENLIVQNKKYRNTLSRKTVRADKALFQIFSETQVYDIVRSLELHHEVPVQFSYFGKGANIWDAYIKECLKTNVPSVITRTIELLKINYGYLDERLRHFDRVNIIDIGVGNAAPVLGLLSHLIKEDKLGRYVALDFSTDMLNLARQSIEDRFGDEVKFEGYQLDISYERFASILAKDYLRQDVRSMNLILFLGSTPNNLRVPGDSFRTICESMNPNDLFIYTGKLAPKDALPEWFEHEFKRKNLTKPEIALQERALFDLLGLKESYYDIEVGFNKVLDMRYARTRLKIGVKVVFDFALGRKELSFEKGDAILLWRAWRATHHNLTSMLEASGFYVLHSSQSEDHNYILTISEVQKD